MGRGALAPFRHRQFALLWSGAFVSNVGTWMQTVGVGILVTETTGRAGWTGLVAAAAFVPAAVFGPVGGALADRVARRRLLLAVYAIETVLAAALTLLSVRGTPSPAVVTVIVFAGGCLASLALPAYQAMLPDLVPADDLLGAMSLSSAQWNLGRVVGPALAGVVIGAGGYGWAFGVNAASFLAVIVAVMLLRLPELRSPGHDPLLRRIAEGARFAREERGVRTALQTMALAAFLAAPFIALVPAMAIKVFGSGSFGTSALVTGQGLGAVTMAVVLGPLADRFGRRRTVVTIATVLPVALVLYASAPRLWLSVASIFVVGGLYLGVLSGLNTVMQLRAPAHLRGRVSSLFMTTLGLLYPLGSVLQGAVADRFGLRATTAGAAAIMGGIVVATRILRPEIERSMDPPAEAPPVRAPSPL